MEKAMRYLVTVLLALGIGITFTKRSAARRAFGVLLSRRGGNEFYRSPLPRAALLEPEKVARFP